MLHSSAVNSYDHPDPFYHNAVIKTPNALDCRKVRLVIDSRDRNKVLFPNPNQYEVNLNDDISNVASIKLISSTFPFSNYLINTTNNILHFEISGTSYEAAIDIGDYSTASDLATAVQTALNTAYTDVAINFKVDYIARTDNFKVRSKMPFVVKCLGGSYTHAFNGNTDYAYMSKSIGEVLGFGVANYNSSLVSTGDAYTNVIQSPFRKNFSINDCIIVHIDMLNVNKSTIDSVNESFAIISRRGVYDSDTQLYDGHQIEKIFVPHIKKITKIKVRIVDYNGNPYDFQNHNHRMEFLIDSQIIQHPF